MAIECFEIKWTGPHTLNSVKGKTEAGDKGIYAIHHGREIYYIGKSTNFGNRLTSHRREWTHALGGKGVERMKVYTGVITVYKSTHPSQDITTKQLACIESFFINYKSPKPKGNPPSDKKGYSGTISPIIVNTGKVILLDKVMFHNPSVEKLLRTSLTPKKRKTFSY